MTRKQKKKLIKILIAFGLFLLLFLTNLVLEQAFSDRFPNGLASIIPNNFGWLLPFFLYLALYFYIGLDVLKKLVVHIKNGNFLDEDFLMSIATIGAISLALYSGINENVPEGVEEAVAVMILFLLGEWFEVFATSKSRKNIKDLMDIKPEEAKLYVDSKEIIVKPEEVKVGSLIIVSPGDKIPIDGIVKEGVSTLDTKSLTGESMPEEVFVNSEVISGSINLTSSLVIETTKEYKDSTVAKILDLVENASNKKSKSEAFITKFAKVYTPIVVFLALILAIIVPLIILLITGNNEYPVWIYRALNFLVVSCPCALVISIPLAFFISLGFASKKGILIKGSIYLEGLNNSKTFVFDKTGTLTKGNFKITSINSKTTNEELLYYASIAEAKSNHPIALAIKEEYGKEIVSDYMIENYSGLGIKAFNKDNVILCGNEKLLEKYNISFDKIDEIGSVVYVARNDKYLGSIVIQDEIKDEAYKMIKYINSIGGKAIMLTGDNNKVASYVCNKLGIKEYKSSLLPIDKVNYVKELVKNNNDVCFLGDGINDAPVILESDIGIAMGGLGSDSAIEAANIVLMNDDLNGLKKAKNIAKRTMMIVYENIVFAILVKVLILVLSTLGITNMWVAIFGDVGVAILCILNAMRCNLK